MKKIIFIYIVGFLFPSFAYTPSSEMILSRWTQQQGLRNYKIVQSVIFSDHSALNESLKLTEEWWRLSNRLFLKVKKGSQVLFLFSYRNSNKYWVNSKRQKVSRSKNYIENYFFVKPEAPEWMSQLEDIRLERAVGVVNYIFNSKKVSLWLEQDEFVLRKLKLDEDQWLTAHNYRLYPGKLFFPQKRIFKSPEMKVEMRVISIHSLSSNQSKQTRLKHIPPTEDNNLLNKFYYHIR